MFGFGMYATKDDIPAPNIHCPTEKTGLSQSKGAAMSLMPCFDPTQGFAEGVIIGRLLAGYGEIELQMCACLIAVERTIDIPIRKIFGKRGAEERIKIGKTTLGSDFANANLWPT